MTQGCLLSGSPDLAIRLDALASKCSAFLISRTRDSGGSWEVSCFPKVNGRWLRFCNVNILPLIAETELALEKDHSQEKVS